MITALARDMCQLSRFEWRPDMSATLVWGRNTVMNLICSAVTRGQWRLMSTSVMWTDWRTLKMCYRLQTSCQVGQHADQDCITIVQPRDHQCNDQCLKGVDWSTIVTDRRTDRRAIAYSVLCTYGICCRALTIIQRQLLNQGTDD